jgi:hypothetical protein
MIQRGEELRFAPEPGQAAGVTREQIGQYFERDVAIQPRIAGAIDLAHRASAEQGNDLVAADPI